MEEAGVLGSRLFFLMSAIYINQGVRVRSGNANMDTKSNLLFPSCQTQPAHLASAERLFSQSLSKPQHHNAKEPHQIEQHELQKEDGTLTTFALTSDSLI
jgi:hypothetical protein